VDSAYRDRCAFFLAAFSSCSPPSELFRIFRRRVSAFFSAMYCRGPQDLSLVLPVFFSASPACYYPPLALHPPPRPSFSPLSFASESRTPVPLPPESWPPIQRPPRAVGDLKRHLICSPHLPSPQGVLYDRAISPPATPHPNSFFQLPNTELQIDPGLFPPSAPCQQRPDCPTVIQLFLVIHPVRAPIENSFFPQTLPPLLSPPVYVSPPLPPDDNATLPVP